MLGNTVWEQLVNSFTNAGTSGWSALISWRHHRELRWTQLYGLPVSPCMNIMNTLKTKVYFSLEQSLTHTHTHMREGTGMRSTETPMMTEWICRPQGLRLCGWNEQPCKLKMAWVSQTCHATQNQVATDLVPCCLLKAMAAQMQRWKCWGFLGWWL